MKIVITGGIGSGKSNVAILLAEKLEYTYVSVDSIVHDLYEDHRIKNALVMLFGTDERKLISNHVFKNPTELSRLEELFEPYIKERLKNYEDAYADLIIEFPMYFENGSSIEFDVVVSVVAFSVSRMARVIKRDGCLAEKVKRIMELQVSDEYRKEHSDYVIENNLGLRELESSVDTLVAQLIMRKALTENQDHVITIDQNVEEILSKLKKAEKKTKKIGLVSGSFDPITLGHTWVIQKALDIVDEVVVAVAINPSKKQLFTPEERGQLITDTLKEVLSEEQFTRVTVNYIKSDEMTVSYAKHIGAKFIFRGLRNSTDFEYENQLNLIQKKIYPEIETILLMTPRELIEISSSLIKGALVLREWERIAQPYVSKVVLEKLKQIAQK